MGSDQNSDTEEGILSIDAMALCSFNDYKILRLGCDDELFFTPCKLKVTILVQQFMFNFYHKCNKRIKSRIGCKNCGFFQFLNESKKFFVPWSNLHKL